MEKFTGILAKFTPKNRTLSESAHIVIDRLITLRDHNPEIFGTWYLCSRPLKIRFNKIFTKNIFYNC